MEKQNGYLRMSGLGENDVSFEGECTITNSKRQTTVEFDESKLGIENTRTYLVISDEIVTLNRVGDFNTFMVFEPEQESCVTVQSPFGNIDMKLATDSFTLNRSEGGFSGEIRYRFVLGEQSMHNILKLDCKIQTLP